MPGHSEDVVVGLKGKVRMVTLPGEEGSNCRSNNVTGDWVILGMNGPIEAVAMENDQHVDVTLIPFFTWANRGRSDVRIWLPRFSSGM